MLVFMTPQVQIWMPAILALFGSLLVVVLTAWLNTKALSAQIEGVDKKLTAQIEALRAETRQGFAELRLDFHTELSFGGKVPYMLKARSLQRRSAIAVIFEDPLFWDLQILILGELEKRCRLARYRVRIPLLLGRYSCVDSRHFHDQAPLHCRRRDAPE